jgi:hypothetical protein
MSVFIKYYIFYSHYYTNVRSTSTLYSKTNISLSVTHIRRCNRAVVPSTRHWTARYVDYLTILHFPLVLLYKHITHIHILFKSQLFAFCHICQTMQRDCTILQTASRSAVCRFSRNILFSVCLTKSTHHTYYFRKPTIRFLPRTVNDAIWLYYPPQSVAQRGLSILQRYIMFYTPHYINVPPCTTSKTNNPLSVTYSKRCNPVILFSTKRHIARYVYCVEILWFYWHLKANKGPMYMEYLKTDIPLSLAYIKLLNRSMRYSGTCVV